MKTEIRTKMKTIQASTAEEFDKLFNKANEELTDVELRWDSSPMCVHLLYKEKKLVPETLAEEFELRGERYHCINCPYFKRGKDKRCRAVGCKYSPYGTVAEYNAACEYFYKQLINGKIEPVEE